MTNFQLQAKELLTNITTAEHESFYFLSDSRSMLRVSEKILTFPNLNMCFKILLIFQSTLTHSKLVLICVPFD